MSHPEPPEATSPPKTATEPRATALLAAIPIALGVVVALGVFSVPPSILAGRAQNPLQLLILALGAAVQFLWAPMLFQLCVAALVALRGARLRRGALGLVLCAAPALAISLFCYDGLTAYGPFRGYWPFIALFTALFGFLFLFTRAIVVGRSRFLTVITLVGFAGFVTLMVLNQTLFPDAYPSLHLAVVQVSQLLLLCAIAGLLTARRSRPQRSWAPRALLIGSFPVMILLPRPLIDAGLCDESQPAFRRFTDLGRADAQLLGAQRRLVPRDPAGSLTLDEPAALALFHKHANFPALPADFDLTRYNVLVVSVDAFAYRETGLSAGSSAATPHLRERRERGGYWFERAYSPAPSTLQSFSALYSMTYPSLLRLTQETPWHGQLSAKETTVASLFKAAGYRTFYAGHNFRMHHGHGPKIRGLLQGIDELHLAPGGHDAPYDPSQDAIILDGAKAALAANAGKKERFFGWIFFESPHAPYLSHYPDMPGATELERYRQETRYVDEQLGALFAELDRKELWRETVVIVLSDHGEGFGLHRRRRHADVYEEITHVPLAVFVPGAAGQRIAAPTSTIYVFPWLLQRGTPAMRKAATDRLRTHIGPMLQHTDGAIISELRCSDCARTAITHPDQSLVYDFPSAYIELYDRAADPDEQDNLFGRDAAHTTEPLRRLEGYLRVRAAGEAALELTGP